MKNFKKVLALVLAIATLLSFATVASAKTASFSDAKDVKNVEAVDVLSYINVLEGYPADKSFKPAKNITREEAAKIIAIFANKSTDISSLYTSANPFADMKGRWGESYVAYGYRAGIIAGKNATSFVPKANVKGTEFLKMVLVVLGYDQNKEGLVGSSWAVNTLELAKAKKLLAGLGKDFNPNAALTRDEAAQIMLNALKAEKVVYGQTITNLTWNAKTGYWMTTNTAANAVYVSPNGAVNNYEHKLLAADFNLKLTDSENTWGQPVHTWTKGTATIGTYRTLDTLLKTYYAKTTECQIAADCGLTKDTPFVVYVDGNKIALADYVQPTDTVGSFGAQGRLTEVYEDRIVMIDTFLAKVTNVTEVKYDAAGHKVNDATITLDVYATKGSTTATPYTLSSATNFTYAKGDYVLVNAKTVAENQNSRSGHAALDLTTTKYGEIYGKAESFEGTQTVIYFNSGKHTVEGTTYDDAATFYLDNAQKSAAKYTWFKDQYGNLIGNVIVATAYSYGVITDMWWVNDGSNGSGKAMANVRYMDDTTNTVEVASIDVLTAGTTVPATISYAPAYADTQSVNNMSFNTTTKAFYVSTNAAANKTADYSTTDSSKKDIIDGHLFQINTLADGKVAFKLVNDGATTATPAHTEKQNIAITNKYAWIGAIGAVNGVRIDADTKFVYASPVNASGALDLTGTYTYKYATGLNEVPTFEAAKVARVDYVLGSDGVADYVYIIGVAKDSETKDFVLVSGAGYYAKLKDTNGVEYFAITLPIKDNDGNTVELKTTKQSVIDALTAANATGKLFYVTYLNGYADSVVEVASIDDAQTATKKVVTFTDNNVNYGAALLNTPKMIGTSTIEETKGTWAKERFNVTNTTELIGSLTGDLSDKNVYVIFEWGTTNNVKTVYVVDKPSSANNVINGKATLTYVAKLYNKAGQYERDVVLGTQVCAFASNTATSETFAPSYATAVSYLTSVPAGVTFTAEGNGTITAAVLAQYDLKSADVQSAVVPANGSYTFYWDVMAK